jgi:glycosyltransferase involved in cell wall biosynthesis
MFEEFLKAEVVVSVPVCDGAPATLMEAFCMGTHVVASGGRTVRDWIARFGGTYGDPRDAAELRALVDRGIAGSRRETADARRARAQEARAAFSRDDLLSPLEQWLATGHPTGDEGKPDAAPVAPP